MSMDLEMWKAAIEARLTALETGATARAESAKAITGQVADDRDLDSEWGDPKIRFPLKEKYWKHQPDTHVERHFSQCEPEYLDAMAKYLDACAYMATKNGGEENEKKAKYKARDAARARGWAARARARGGASYATDAEAQDFVNGTDDEIPFVRDMTTSGAWGRP